MTASKSIKFEISLKELKVTFEGDIQSAERMHGEITGAINSLAAAQSKMLTAGQKPAPAAVVAEPAPGGRRRRGRRRASGSGIDPAILVEGGAPAPEGSDDTPEDAGGGERRTGDGAQTTLLAELKHDGFFSTKRTLGEVRAALAAKGHTFKSTDISPTVVRLTRQRVLQRERDPGKDQWVYFTT